MLSILPYSPIALLSFPGVTLHELSKKIICDTLKVGISDVCYFRVRDPIGYLIHSKPKTFTQIILIYFGPTAVNSIACVSLMTMAFHLANNQTAMNTPARVAILPLIWLAISFGIHAFPSIYDVNHNLLNNKEVPNKTRMLVLAVKISTVLRLPLLGLLWAFALTLVANNVSGV